MGERKERTFWIRLVRSGGGTPEDLHYTPRSDDFPDFIVALPRSENGFVLTLWRKTFATKAAGHAYAVYEEIPPGSDVYVPYAVPDTQLGEWRGPPLSG